MVVPVSFWFHEIVFALVIAGQDLLNQHIPLCCDLFTHSCIPLFIEIIRSFDPGLFTRCIGRKGIIIPDDKIAVLPLFQRSHVLVNTQLFGGIDGHKFQRFLWETPPYFTALAASVFMRRASSLLSEL